MTIAEMTVSTEALLARYRVDLDHARHVAALALAIFDGAEHVHRLPAKARRLLELGTLLHNVGMTSNPQQHHIVGRDIVLGSDLAELDMDERAVIACMVAFHRKKVRPGLEPAYLSLGKKNQDLALRLSALLRVADGLDYSQSQTTTLVACEEHGDALCLRLRGPHAAADGARAVEKADLWSKVFESELTVEVESAEAADAGAAPAPAPSDGVEPPESATQIATFSSQLPLAEHGRLLLRRYFRRLLSEERDIREKDDPEAIHQLRVASRRLRATLMILAEVAPAAQVRQFRRGVQRVATAAGTVRDCDVFLAQVRSYAAQLPEERRGEVRPLIAALEHDRAEAHELLIARLDGERYAGFKREFAGFMTDSADGWNTTLRVRDRAGSIIWQRYEALRAHEAQLHFDALTPEHAPLLHELRLDGKRLRYVLDVFEEVLGERGAVVVEPLVQLQDYLGELQDIAVAEQYVAGLELDAAEQPGMATYVAAREAERAHLLAGLAQRWEKLTNATYRKKLMEALIKM